MGRHRTHGTPASGECARHASACTARRDSLTWRRLEIVALDGMPLAYYDPHHRRGLRNISWCHQAGGSKSSLPARRGEFIQHYAPDVWILPPRAIRIPK